MMEIATDALLDIGVPAKHILYERFDDERPAARWIKSGATKLW